MPFTGVFMYSNVCIQARVVLRVLSASDSHNGVPCYHSGGGRITRRPVGRGVGAQWGAPPQVHDEDMDL